jgi:hypothetical protein
VIIRRSGSPTLQVFDLELRAEGPDNPCAQAEVEVGDSVEAVNEYRSGQEHEGQSCRNGQRARNAAPGNLLDSSPDQGGENRAYAVDQKVPELPAQQPEIDGQEQVFVEQSAGAEDRQNPENGLSPTPADWLEDVALEPAVNPYVVPAPEIEYRMRQYRIAESIAQAETRKRERADE